MRNDNKIARKYLVEIVGDVADEAVTNEYMIIKYMWLYISVYVYIYINVVFSKKINDRNHFSLSLWRVEFDP